MEPTNNDWLGSCKSQPVKDAQINGNVAQSWQWRERGMNPLRGAPTRTVLEHVAEDRLVHKGHLNVKCCDLPGFPRSTFLMIFSPDGTTVASTHGNHNIYLTELSRGRHVRILKGHPRTPWCIAFHPSHADLVGSGCLGGQVRVWDSTGGSEVWTVEKETVIASIAFHPRDHLLVVATYNELYFWDWSQPQPFTKVCTNNINEKVRYVAFDSLGYKLITGISVWPPGGGAASLLQTAQGGGGGAGGASPPAPPPPGARPDSSTQELIFTSYHNLVQRYDSLVRNYHRLFLARSQGTNTTDRGTDPMELDGSSVRPRPSAPPFNLFNANTSTENMESDRTERREQEGSPASRLLSLDVLSLDNTGPGSEPADRAHESSPRNEQSPSSRAEEDRLMIWESRSSALQGLLNGDPYALAEHRRRIFRRIFPNPFSSSSLSQTDLRHRLSNRHSTASRTREFDRTIPTSENPTNAAPFFVQNLDSSSRTRGYTSLRRDGVSGDTNSSTPRPLLRSEPDVNDETIRRRRALERLLEWEQAPAEDSHASSDIPSTHEPRPPTRSALEEMLFGPRSNRVSPETFNSTPVPPVASVVPDDNVFEPQVPSPESSQRDPGLRALLNFNIFGRADPQNAAPSSFQGVNYFPTPPIDDEPELNNTNVGSMEYFQNLRQHPNPSPGSTTLPASRATTEQTAANDSAPPATARSQPGPSSVHSQNITDSLDIIRDILRDSGNRLLNLITDMSLSTLAGVGEDPEREQTEQTHDHDNNASRTDGRRRGPLLPTISASDSDSDRSVEVNIYRTRNATIPENRSTDADNTESERVQRSTSRMVVNLDLGGPDEGYASEHGSIRRTLNNNRINITVSNNRFRLRTNNVNDNNTSTAERRTDDRAHTAERRPEGRAHTVERMSEDHAYARTDSAPTPANLNTGLNAPGGSSEHQRGLSDSPRPSTSRSTDWLHDIMGLPPGERPAEPLSSADALRKVKHGIAALQQHTTRITEMWLRGTRSSMRDIRLMWEDLRRYIVALQRQTTLDDTPSYYSRSILDRCNMLNDITRRLTRRNSSANTLEAAIQANVPVSTEERNQTVIGGESSNRDAEQPSTSRGSNDHTQTPLSATPRTSAWARNKRANPTAARSSFKARPTPSARRRMQERRRQRIIQRMEQYLQGSRSTSRTRHRENMRHFELHFTRHEIRLRAMQVLSIMFNMMMACLEEGELSAQIILMLRTLKKALGVTCLLLMANRLMRREMAPTLNLRRRNSAGPSPDRPQNATRASGANPIAGSQPMDQTTSSNLETQRTLASSTVRIPIESRGTENVTNPARDDGAASFSQSNEHLRTGTSSNRSASERFRRLKFMFEHFRRDPITQTPLNSSETQQTSTSSPANASSTNLETRPDLASNTERAPTERRENVTTDTVNVNLTGPTTAERSRLSEMIEQVRSVQAATRNAESALYNPPNKANKSTSTPTQTAISSAQNHFSTTASIAGTSGDSQPSTSQRWSNRLAVQISAANNNQSDTAKSRKDVYMERKKQKALHRYNPIAHPLAKRKTAPPMTSHRIPTPRAVPRRKTTRVPVRDYCSHQRRMDIELNPSDDPQPSTSAADAPDGLPITIQEYRAGLIRFAQFHAARLRNATRNRYRIRLYTPSSVREMFDILTTSGNEREPESPPPLNNAPENRRSFSTYRPRLLTVRNNLESLNRSPEGSPPFGSILNNVSVPLVQVNNIPVNDPQGGGDAPPRVNEYLQPIILAQNALVVEEPGGGAFLEAGLMSESPVVPTHRVQAWDFTRGAAPDIKDSTKNVVVQRCKIHNDASIDISRDGRLLVALLPVHRMRNMSHRLGVYSLEWGRLGQCLHTAVLEQSAVSVALSPTARHLAVGLGSRRVTTLPHSRNNVFALLFKLADEGPVNENSRHCGLVPVRILDHNWEHSFTSLNCLRWAPAPGQGLLYANNTGQLIIMS